MSLGAYGRAAAQTGSAGPLPIAAGFRDGFYLESADGDYQLVLGMVAQTDGRFALGDPTPIVDTFTIKKIRPTFSGRIAKYFDFKVMPDFGNGTTLVQDAYIDIRFSSKFRVRSGKNKTPVGYELLISDSNLLFPERTLASSLVPNRDIGIQVQGDLAGGTLSYAAGVFNGVPDGTSSTTELDTNNSKDLAGRVVMQPFTSSTTPASPLHGLGFHIGGSTGRQIGALPSFRTSVGETYFSYAATASANGVRNRVSPAVFYYYKSFGGFAEYMRSAEPVSHGTAVTDVANHAWEATGSVLVTGETATDRVVRPANNFDPINGHWGALQLLARYTGLTVDRSVLAAGLAAVGASLQARSFTIAANWYPNPYIKFYTTFERTTFDNNAAGGRPPEDVILFRTQLAF
jgi:phosphate-selective porin OprO/OprP